MSGNGNFLKDMLWYIQRCYPNFPYYQNFLKGMRWYIQRLSKSRGLTSRKSVYIGGMPNAHCPIQFWGQKRYPNLCFLHFYCIVVTNISKCMLLGSQSCPSWIDGCICISLCIGLFLCICICYMICRCICLCICISLCIGICLCKRTRRPGR